MAQALAGGTGLGATPEEARLANPLTPQPLNPDVPQYVVKTKGIRTKIADYVQLRIENPDISYDDAAKELGISKNTLRNYVFRAVSEGWLRFEDPLSRLDFEIIPQATQVTLDALAAKDVKVAIEVMKGTVFPEYRAIRGTADAVNNTIAIQVVGGEGEPQVNIRSRGVPKGALGPKEQAPDSIPALQGQGTQDYDS